MVAMMGKEVCPLWARATSATFAATSASLIPGRAIFIAARCISALISTALSISAISSADRCINVDCEPFEGELERSPSQKVAD